MIIYVMELAFRHNRLEICIEYNPSVRDKRWFMILLDADMRQTITRTDAENNHITSWLLPR